MGFVVPLQRVVVQEPVVVDFYYESVLPFPLVLIGDWLAETKISLNQRKFL